MLNLLKLFMNSKYNGGCRTIDLVKPIINTVSSENHSSIIQTFHTAVYILYIDRHISQNTTVLFLSIVVHNKYILSVF